MTKRDDESGADMEVGMTTAERRRRRRRGGGLRVPSDNVPRRASTPPVVAPVPEDPSLAMSIAYSFTSESSDPIARPTLETPAPSFENQEAMPTVIDPVSGPVEQADFEMKTREMTAVDLEALGLSDAALAGTTIPMQRISSSSLESTMPPEPSASPGFEVRFHKRDATDPVDDVDVDIDSGLEAVDGGTTLDQADDDRSDDTSSDFAEVDSAEFNALSVDAAEESSQMMPPIAEPVRPPAVPYKTGRAQTVALSEDDLEEVREAARLATQPPARPVSSSMPPPMPQSKPAEAKLRPDPPSVPEIDINALEDKASETSGEFEVDVDGIVESRAPVVPVAPVAPIAHEPRTRPPSQPPGHQSHSQSHPGLHPSAPPATHPPGHAAGHAPAHPPAPPSTQPPTPPPMTLPATPRDSQPMPALRDPHAPPPTPHAPPPTPPAVHKAPPAPPPAKKSPPPPISSQLAKDGKPPRGKPWFVDLFDEDYLRTLPFLTPQATQAEAEFVIDAMGLTPGAQVLDIGCGYGRHAMELAARGFHVVGLDMSTPLLVRGGEEAHRRGLTINFIRGDMRELDFDAQFDGAYCLSSTFGYFDDETNKKTVGNISRALRPGGRLLLEILNRDYVIADLPTRVWWEGDGCVVLEEVELNYFSSRIQVNRSVVFDDGRQLEQEISVRAYSLHEVGKLLHSAGFRVLEVSGAYHTRGRFFGNQSRHIIVLAERKDPSAT